MLDAKYSHPLWSEGDTTYSFERSDCTVRAVSLACNVPYGVAHEYLARAGRKPKKGFAFGAHMMGRKELLGSAVEQIELPGLGRGYPTVARVLPRCTNGRYIVKVKGHVFTVVDGQVFDRGGTGTRSRVRRVWKITPPASVAPVIPIKIPTFTLAPAPVEWIVTRYRELVAAGKLDNAARLYKNATPKMQKLMREEAQ